MMRHWALLGMVLGIGCGGKDNGPSPGTAGASACATGSEGCACYGNKTCDGTLVCASNLCVSLTGSGGSGPAASAGEGGNADEPNGSGEGGNSDEPNGSGEGGNSDEPNGSGEGGAGNSTGNTGEGGSAQSAGTTGEGGTTSSAGATGKGGNVNAAGAAGTGSGSTADTCNNASATTIDNFASCDNNICDLAGRHGGWFSYADNGINMDFGVRVPPSGWGWQACSAVVIGGPRTSGSQEYAGAGVLLNSGNAYDASSFTGVRVRLESDAEVWVAIETTDGGRFGKAVPASNAVVRDVSFASMIAQADSSTETMDLALLKQISFSPEDPSVGFGFLIADLSFY